MPIEFNLSATRRSNESRVNAESQTAAPKNPETSRRCSEAGQTAGEARVGGAGREEGKGEEGKSKERKGSDRKSEKGQADQGGAWQARGEEEHCGRGQERRVLAFLEQSASSADRSITESPRPRAAAATVGS